MPHSDPRQLLAALTELEAQRDPAMLSPRRRYNRLVVRCQAELLAADAERNNQPPIAIQVRDVSRTGLGFLCSQKLAIHSVWRLCIFSHGHVAGQQAIVVRHATEVMPGAYLVGGQFCIETGLLCLLGVDPRQIEQLEPPADPEDDLFLPPAEVA